MKDLDRYQKEQSAEPDYYKSLICSKVSSLIEDDISPQKIAGRFRSFVKQENPNLNWLIDVEDIAMRFCDFYPDVNMKSAKNYVAMRIWKNKIEMMSVLNQNMKIVSVIASKGQDIKDNVYSAVHKAAKGITDDTDLAKAIAIAAIDEIEPFYTQMNEVVYRMVSNGMPNTPVLEEAA